MLNIKSIKAKANIIEDLIKSLSFTSYDSAQRTPLTGVEAEDKVDMIEYLNSAMDKQAVQVLTAFSDIALSQSSIAVIEDIFEEGVLIRYLANPHSSNDNNNQHNNELNDQSKKSVIKNIDSHPDSKAVFIPFRTQRGRPLQRLYILGAEAQIRQGIFNDVVASLIPSSAEKHDFTVTKAEYLTKNMIRIHIKSDVALPQDDPGYAYRFLLTKSQAGQPSVLQQRLDVAMKLWQSVEPKLNQLPYMDTTINNSKKYALWAALEVFKRLPEAKQAEATDTELTQSNENNIEQTSANQKRYYTLRQLKRNADPFTGEVDIYIHNDTPGSVWASSLQAGDTIKIDTHYHETIKQMTVGQPLFICDETSMPTVTAALEQWQQETIPVVIAITNDQADFNYFDEMQLPDSLQEALNIEYINASEVDNLAESVIERIKQQNTKIDCAWGAIGKADFRPIKQYLKQHHGLTGKVNRVRAYWV